MNYISVTTSGGTAWLSHPDSVEYIKNKELSRLYFWSSTTVIDRGKRSEQVVLTGTEVIDSDATSVNASLRISCMDTVARGGYPVVIANLDDDTYNGTYYIKSFDYNEMGGYLEVFNWNLNMEKVSSVVAVTPPPTSIAYTHTHTDVLAFGEHVSATKVTFPMAFPLPFEIEF